MIKINLSSVYYKASTQDVGRTAKVLELGDRWFSKQFHIIHSFILQELMRSTITMLNKAQGYMGLRCPLQEYFEIRTFV